MTGRIILQPNMTTQLPVQMIHISEKPIIMRYQLIKFLFIQKLILIKQLSANPLFHPFRNLIYQLQVMKINMPEDLFQRLSGKRSLKKKHPPDTPLKGYEIAEAGVSGLNKLLGWQMALDMKKDENGQPKSVSFSSGILKIQAPVKKREPQP